MNILFVFTVKDHKYRPGEPLLKGFRAQLGISYISSVLKRSGHNTELLVCCSSTPSASIKETLERLSPGLVCFTAVYSEYAFAKEIALKIRSIRPNAFLLVGGIHVTLNPDEAIRDIWDALCIGEGEHSTCELVRRLGAGLPIGEIPGLWIKTATGLRKGPLSTFDQDLSGLPHPDREMWEPWIEPKPERLSILLGRGCPFQCTYCCNHKLRTSASGQYVRIRNSQDVISEVHELAAHYPSLKHIYFEIETLSIHQAAAFQLTEALLQYNLQRFQRGLRPITFHANIRILPHHSLEPLFRAMRRCGFAAVNIGLESGSEHVRERYLNRVYSNADVKATVAAARRSGLAVFVYVLVGIPGERVEDFRQTVQLLREIELQGMNSYIVFPYPGTEMYEWVCRQELLRGAPDLKQERCRATMSLPGFSRHQIERAFDWLPWLVFRGRRPALALLREVLKRKFTRRGWFGLKHYG